MSQVFDDLKQSLEEALAMTQGEAIGHCTHFPDPREVRKNAKLTQAEMAPLMGMSLSGYRKWEQGQRAVSGPALNLLRVMAKNPAVVIESLQ